MKRILAVLVLCLPLLAAAKPAEKPPAESQKLAAVLAEYDKLLLDREPTLRMQRGLDVEKLPELSFEAAQRDARALRALRQRLALVDPRRLTHEEWLSREILDWQLATYAEGADHFWDFFQVTPYASPFRSSLHQVFTSFNFRTEKDRQRYLDLLRQYVRVVGQLRANLEAQRAKGILLPKAEIDPVVALIRTFVRPPEESLFWVDSKRLQTFYPEGAVAFQGEVRKRIETQVNPALEALAAVPDAKAYRDTAPEQAGLGQYPGGPQAYAYVVRVHTTLEGVTPEAIHQRGLQEIARLNGRLEELRKQVRFEGDLAAFRAFLKTDPRFFAKTPEEVSQRLLAPVKRIEPRVPSYFGRVPKAPYGVARLEPELEGAMTYGYYRQPMPGHAEGDYMFNGSKLDERSMLSAATLIYHELIPGHHFQLSLQSENGSLPAFRKASYPTAFVEGWAMYASGLAEEMGGYADPYDLAGWIAQDLFLTSRLVVDTGMSALGWTREKAIAYMKENTLESDTQIGTETLRYAVDIPAQALAYKMGSSEIWDLRRHAEKELGDRFDVRRFHDTVLGSGAMPMTVLRKHVDWWIDQEKGRSTVR